MFKEILKDPKLLATIGTTIIALVLIYVLLQTNVMFSNSTERINETIRDNTVATQESIQASRHLQALILEAIGEEAITRNGLNK